MWVGGAKKINTAGKKHRVQLYVFSLNGQALLLGLLCILAKSLVCFSKYPCPTIKEHFVNCNGLTSIALLSIGLIHTYKRKLVDLLTIYQIIGVLSLYRL